MTSIPQRNSEKKLQLEVSRKELRFSARSHAEACVVQVFGSGGTGPFADRAHKRHPRMRSLLNFCLELSVVCPR